MAARVEAMVSGWRQHEERNLLVDLLRVGVDLSALAIFGFEAEACIAPLIDTLTDLEALGRATLPTAASERFDLARRRAVFARLDESVREAIATWSRAPRRPDCILAELVDSGLLDERELARELCVILLASVAAPVAAAWSLYELHVHPSSRDRIEAELDHQLGGRRPTASELAALPTLDRVIKESLRLHPPFALIAPWVERPWVHVCPHQLHRDPAIWPRPSSFEPDRWEPESSHHRAAAQAYYMPFGYGSRRTIADQLSILQIQLILATVAQRVHLDLRAGYRLVHDTTPPVSLVPIGSTMPMRVGPRSMPRVGPSAR